MKLVIPLHILLCLRIYCTIFDTNTRLVICVLTKISIAVRHSTSDILTVPQLMKRTQTGYTAMFAEDRQSHIRLSTVVLHEAQEQFFICRLCYSPNNNGFKHNRVGIGPQDKIHQSLAYLTISL